MQSMLVVARAWPISCSSNYYVKRCCQQQHATQVKPMLQGRPTSPACISSGCLHVGQHPSKPGAFPCAHPLSPDACLSC
jgi:hypothetical protein